MNAFEEQKLQIEALVDESREKDVRIEELESKNQCLRDALDRLIAKIKEFVND